MVSDLFLTNRGYGQPYIIVIFEEYWPKYLHTGHKHYFYG